MKHWNSNIFYDQKPEINIGDFIDNFIVLAKNNNHLYLNDNQKYALICKGLTISRTEPAIIEEYSIEIIYNMRIK